jgi:hypothetical protein
MSKWRKALKNKRRFDARYFLGEREEGKQETVENSRQQEKLNDFRNFSFDSWLTEEVVDESNCGADKRDDEEEDLEEAAKPDFLDLDKDGDKEEPMKKAAEEAEDLEELVVPGVMPKGDGDAKGMTPEEIRMAKAKEKMDLMRKAAKGKPPVRKDVKAGLEEDLEEG